MGLCIQSDSTQNKAGVLRGGERSIGRRGQEGGERTGKEQIDAEALMEEEGSKMKVWKRG